MRHPEARRRAKIEETPGLRNLWPNFELYASVRLHAINNFNVENEFTEFALWDGTPRKDELTLGFRWDFGK